MTCVVDERNHRILHVIDFQDTPTECEIYEYRDKQLYPRIDLLCRLQLTFLPYFYNYFGLGAEIVALADVSTNKI